MRIAKVASWLLYGVVLSVFLFIVVASLWGWRFDVVPTGSMAPAFNPGGMVVTRPASIADIEVGDAVLFAETQIQGEAHVCHRVMDVRQIGGELFLETKGDANKHPDAELVSAHNFVGKTILYIPHVGSIAHLTRLHQVAITVMGAKVSFATLLFGVMGLMIMTAELANIGESMLWTDSVRRRERLKERRQRLARRRERFT